MKRHYSDILNKILQYSKKPPLFEPGEARFWDDPHISRGMLEAHLNPNIDLASRKHKTIDQEVNHLVSCGILKPGDRLLDLGCGPGLYASRLAEKGIKVTGIDISKRSLDYAFAQAKEKGLDIEYRLMDFFNIDYAAEFDAAIQTYGELNTFADKKLNELLSKINRSLKPGGRLVFDVTTRKLRGRAGIKNGWSISGGGFWRSGRHLILTQGFDYPEESTWLDRYIIVDDDDIKVYHNWFHDYDLRTIRQVLKNAGFITEQVWNDLTGTPYKAGGDWMAIAARKG